MAILEWPRRIRDLIAPICPGQHAWKVDLEVAGGVTRERLLQAVPRLLFESALIVLSILLALAVAEWRDARRERAQVATALDAIARELADNRQAVTRELPYHQEVRGALAALVRDPEAVAATARGQRADWGSEVAPEGLRAPALRSTAWETAQAQGILLAMDYDVAYLVAGVYGIQQLGVAQTVPRLVDAIFAPASFDPEQLPALLHQILALTNELVEQERYLLATYDRALASLAERAVPAAVESGRKVAAASGEPVP